MGTAADTRRRLVATGTITDLGHVPVFFEAQPARPLPRGTDTWEYLRNLVRGSQILLAIVDDAVTGAMSVELDTANDALGEDRVFYYFTGGERDESAQTLWDAVLDSNKLATFSTDAQLGVEIRRSIASYIDDVLQASRTEPEILVNGRETFDANDLKWWPFELEEGDTVDATLTGSGSFYATLVDADGFARLHNNRRGRGMKTGSEKSAHHFRREVGESGTFYLMVRTSILAPNGLIVNARVVRR